MGKGRATALVCWIAMLGGAAAPVAHASDAGLRKVVLRQEGKLQPLAVAFRQADTALATTPDTNAASAAAGAFRPGLRHAKQAIVPIKTTSTRARKGKKRMLSAIRKFELGLVSYQELLDKAAAGAGKDALRSSFLAVNRRLSKAAKDEAAALDLLPIRG